jgi:hypothetical protein
MHIIFIYILAVLADYEMEGEDDEEEEEGDRK